MMKSKMFMGALLGAALAIGGLPQQALPVLQTRQVGTRRHRNVFPGLNQKATLTGTRYSRRTVAMDKRAAKKKRNQMRNKRR